MAVLTPSVTVAPRVPLKRDRMLPCPGKVLVEKGDKVLRSMTVAYSEVEGDLLIIRASERLGIEPFEVLQGIKVEPGMSVTKGQLLCEHKGLFGLFKSTLLSPEEGIVELITAETGNISLRLPPRRVELKAFVSGQVSEVFPSGGVTIETEGALVQGIFGVGGETTGTLDLFEEGMKNFEGKIVFTQFPLTTSFLQRLVTQGAVGVICPSIDADALREYVGYDIGVAVTGDEEVPATLMLTEGFGELAMNPRTFELLHSLRGAPASLTGVTQVRAGAVRPELIVSEEEFPLPQKSSVSGTQSLDIGVQVRIIRVPHFGEFGTVTALPSVQQKLPSGSLARVVEVALQGGQVVTVPRANVELIE